MITNKQDLPIKKEISLAITAFIQGDKNYSKTILTPAKKLQLSIRSVKINKINLLSIKLFLGVTPDVSEDNLPEARLNIITHTTSPDEIADILWEGFKNKSISAISCIEEQIWDLKRQKKIIRNEVLQK